MTGGTDTEIYRKKIKHYWGLEPLEGYGSTEAGTMCMQSWNFKGMTFFPDSCFLEFIPLEDLIEYEKNPNHPLKTVLFDELEVGIYELVFSNFHGGIFMRYRVGDMFEIISIGDEEINCTLPQVRYYSRDIDIIDIGSMARFSEKDIWKAIEETGINYFDWVARKEIIEGEPTLHIYLEVNPGVPLSETEVYELVDKHLSRQVTEFRDCKSMLNHNPLKVSLLRPGSFAGYMEAQQRAGADLGHYKPPHMQPKDHIMEKLFSIKSSS
jgi:phenylacetate-coenzyme A ligase PaaK-like adenylate-forming protein